MDTKNARALAAITLQKGKDDNPNRPVVLMPIGTEIVGVGLSRTGGVELYAIVGMEIGPLVEHQLALLPAEIPQVPTLGKTFGSPIGFITMAGTPIAVVPELPWPTHADAVN